MQSIDRALASSAGIFITLEGPDGAGKSTQLAELVDRVSATGRSVVATREPGGTALSEQVRTVLLAWTGPQDPITDALLFNAARRQLVNDIIRPALDTGQTVISDRFADSTLAYQGYGAGAPLDALHRLAHIATDGLEPNRTVLLDLPVEMGLQRRRGGPADQLTRFETDGQNDRAFHERVRAGYLEMAAADPHRWRVVDATASPAVVADAVWEAVRDLVEP